jgi:hypothetical protein
MNPLPFQYSIRAQMLRYMSETDREAAQEQRDRELEDYLGRLVGNISLSPPAVASGFSLNSFSGGYNMVVGWFYLDVTRTGSAISVGDTGDIGNTLVATGAGWPPRASAIGLSSGVVGRVASGQLTTGNAIYVNAVGGAASIDTGDRLSFYATFPVGG